MMWVVGRVRCLFGHHERSAHHARRVPDTESYESVCTYCGVPMQRLSKRNWVVKAKAKRAG